MANAGYYIDPYVGLDAGQWETSYSGSTAESEIYGNTLGYAYGLRTGYFYRNFFYGIEYSTSSVDWKYNQANDFGEDNDWVDVKGNKTSTGPSFGFHSTKSEFHIWLTYFLIDQLKLDKDHDPDFEPPSYEGTGFGLGIGIGIKKYLWINMEYRSHIYNKKTVDGQSDSLPGTFNGVEFETLNHTTWLFTVSFPFGNLGK